MDVASGTIAVWSDVACPWATLAVHRIRSARARLGLDGEVVIDHRCFPLELHNERATPWRTLSAEVPVVGSREPALHFRVWDAPVWQWPVTTLLALEAVQAAKEQGLAASEALDSGLRRALFAESRCVSLRHVVLEVAAACDGVDARRLADALDSGSARRRVMDDHRLTGEAGVKGSPHVFLPDGRDLFNPGMETHWEGEHGEGFPIVDADDPSVYDGLVRAAAGSKPDPA